MRSLKNPRWNHLNSFTGRLLYTMDMADSSTHLPDPSQRHSESSEPESKPRKPIPLISVPNDRDMIAEEMEELFDEDKVTHKHGSSEPEAD